MTFWRKGEEKPTEPNLKEMCLKTPVYKNGEEVLIPEESQELREHLYNIALKEFPFHRVIDTGYTSEDEKRLEELLQEGKYIEVATAMMRSPKVLKDKEYIKTVREYLEKSGLPIENLLKESEYALLAILTFANKYCEQRKPKEKKKSLLERDDFDVADIFDKKKRKEKKDEPEETDPIKSIFGK